MVSARQARWWPEAVALAAAAIALLMSLLIPLTFSDPNGVDPYLARFAGSIAFLLLATTVIRRLRPALPVMLGLAAGIIPFCVWTATPVLLEWALPHVYASPSLTWDEITLLASTIMVLLTVAACIAGCRWLPADARPNLRLPLTWSGVRWSAIGMVLLLVGFIAIPAELLGRVAVEPAAFVRDGGWLVPAFVLQGGIQELAFRGLLLSCLERHMSANWANLIQALVFGLCHLAIVYEGPLLPFVPVTILLGLVFGWITQRTHSIWPVVLVHAAAEVLVGVAIIQGLYGA